MKQRVFSLVALWFISIAAYSQCGFTAGNENPGFTTPGNFSPNYILGNKYNVPVNGTLVSLNIFGLGTNSNFQMCLYEDNGGVPGNLITTSAAGVVTNGVLALPVTPVVLPAGDYWLMAIYDNAGGSSGHTYYTTSSPATVYYQSLIYGSPMPANAAGFLTYTGQDFHYWMVFEGGNTSSSVTETVCGSDYVAPSGAVYNASGVYQDIIPNMVGCDSIITIDLTLISASSSSIIETACDSYVSPSGATYIASGIYLDTISNVMGCDSIITIDLTINTVNVGVTQSASDITAAAAGAVYQWLDCNDLYVVLSGENGQTMIPSINGNYAVEVTENGCVDTSSCIEFNLIGMDETSENFEFAVYPNPTSGELNVVLDPACKNCVLVITDATGRLINTQQHFEENVAVINFEGASGIYLLKVVFENGEIRTLRFVRN